MTSEHFASSSRVVNLISMALALFRNESYQRINVPIRTNTQKFCLVRAVHYQTAPHHPGTRQEPTRFVNVQAVSSPISRLAKISISAGFPQEDQGSGSPFMNGVSQ